MNREVIVTMEALRAQRALDAEPGNPFAVFEVFDPSVLIGPVRIGHGSRVDSFCKLEGGLGLWIGERVHIASFCHIGLGGGVTIIEDEVGISSHVVIASGTNELSGRTWSASADAVIRRDLTRIGARVALMAGCIIRPGVTIGEGAAVAAGSVVTKDIPAGELWAGVPARFMKMAR